MKRIVFLLLSSALLFAAGCGGGSSSSSNGGSGTNSNTSTAGGNTIVTSGNNVAPLLVDAGPAGEQYSQTNIAYTTVILCPAGSSSSSDPNCQKIDHVAVDTGSTGLRIPYGVLNSSLASALQTLTVSATVNGTSSTFPLTECVQFLDTSYFWGSVRSADVYIGGSANNGEVAHSVPVQIMGDPAYPSSSIPPDCSSTTTLSGTNVTGTEEDSVLYLGANGLIGVGLLQYDCDYYGSANGNACTSVSSLPGATYYACSGTSCCSGNICTNSSLSVPITEQLRNPVSAFSTDNNGVIVEMPSVPVGGQSTVASGTGSLVFGIGTESNNSLASGATVLPIDTNENNPDWSGFTTTYNGTKYPNTSELNALVSYDPYLYTIGSFIDSGSNLLYFLDSSDSGIASCVGNLLGYYCPTSGSGTYMTQTLTATNTASNGNSRPVQFDVSNANLLNFSTNTAFSDIAGPNSTGSIDSITQASDGYFDFGLPFFYGRNVYVGIQGVTPPSGVTAGPFWAY